MQWPLVGREAALDHAARQLDEGTGVAILGPAGVGKSRLLHELADRAERSGAAVVHAVASATTSTIPFAPFVELLPGGPTPDRLAMLGAARQALEARRTTQGLLIAIDDAHHLDDTSLALVISAVGSGIATVAMTARTGEPMTSDLLDLWTNGVIQRIDVGPLGRDDARELIATTLGEITPELEAELWRLTQGNPLLLHELVEGAAGRTMRRDDDGTWHLCGSLAESPRLSDLVRSRLEALPDALRTAMDVVAVGSPLPWELAVATIGDHLAALEDRDLIATSGSAAERRLVPAHPLYGEILAAHLGDVRRRAAHLTLAEVAQRSEHLTDPLRAALWQLDGGGAIAPQLALAGAQQALVRHDPALAERLLRPLDHRDVAVGVLLGRALSYTQRFAEAEEVLAALAPVDAGSISEVASIRAQNMGFGLARVQDACELLDRAAEQLEVPDLRARLINERAMVSAIHGDFEGSRAASDQVLADPETSDVSRAAAYVTLTVALAMTGDCDRMDEVIEDALAVSERAVEVLPFARDQVGVMQMASALHAGRLEEAKAMAGAALEQDARGNALTTTWLAASVMGHELTGQIADALAVAEAALPMFAEADPFGLEAQVRGLIALTNGQQGRSTPEDFVDARELPTTGARLSVWLHRGKAWSAAAAGDIDRAVELAVAGGRNGIDGEHYAWAAFSLSDAVRFGAADRVVDDLRAIDTSRGAHLLAAIRDHGDALAAGDVEGLVGVAERFVGMRAWLLAADAFAQAAAAYDSAGRSVESARCAARSMAAERRCQEPVTPALTARPALVSTREIEVALDAAEGLTSPQIAERRYISVRTVDNHLRSVYRKLAVSGRNELADHLPM